MTAINATANFSIENTWGYLDPKTGLINGMVGQLLRQEADIGGTGLYMVPGRISQMDFITMMVNTRAELVFRAPPLSYVSNIYYYPFVGIVWIATTVLLLFGAIAIYFTYILPNDERRNHSRDSVSDTMLLAAGLASQMGLHIEPRIISGRIATVINSSNTTHSNFQMFKFQMVSRFLLVYIIDLSIIRGNFLYSEHSRPTAVNDKKYYNARRCSELRSFL